MRATTQRFVSRAIAGLLVQAMLSLSAVQAADVVQWSDLPKKIGGKMRSDDVNSRRYRVVTRDGRSYAGYGLFFGAVGVSVRESDAAIPREQVMEIHIHRYGPLWQALFTPAGAITPGTSGGGGDYDFGDPFKILLMVPVWMGVTAVSAPVVLPIEGVKRLLPDKVYRVAP